MNTQPTDPQDEKNAIPSHAEHARTSASLLRQLLRSFQEFSEKFIGRAQYSQINLITSLKAEADAHAKLLRRIAELEAKVEALTKLLQSLLRMSRG